MARKATATQATQVGAGDLQAQMDALAKQNADILAQNQSLMAIVAGMGAQVSAPAEQVHVFDPPMKRVEMTDAVRDRIKSTYGIEDAKLADKIKSGRANAMSNMHLRVDESKGMVWVGFDYTHAYGVTEAGNKAIFHGGGQHSVQISHKLASGQLLELNFGLPKWFIVKS